MVDSIFQVITRNCGFKSEPEPEQETCLIQHQIENLIEDLYSGVDLPLKVPECIEDWRQKFDCDLIIKKEDFENLFNICFQCSVDFVTFEKAIGEIPGVFMRGNNYVFIPVKELIEIRKVPKRRP